MRITAGTASTSDDAISRALEYPRMRDRNDNILPFPLERRPTVSGCPQCGARSNVWQIGRLLWGYCVDHELRWVAADLKNVRTENLDRRQMRRGLEFLASFVEVSH